ncbi:hypothetical protein PFISCL1PPCAC_25122, partial [Pristionchus fissidentatus]
DVFQTIFDIYNNCTKYTRITLANVTMIEKQIVCNCFTQFLKGLYEDCTIYLQADGIREREIGMVRFRLEILPIFIALLEETGGQLAFPISTIASTEMRV